MGLAVCGRAGGVDRVAAGSRPYPGPLSDLGLQRTLYLVGRLLSTVTGRLVGQVDGFQFHPLSN